MTKRLRTIITPALTTDLAVADEPLTYWKQILPESDIHYDGRVLHFDRAYHEDLIRSFRNREVEQTMFQLANPLNSHGRDMDPERQRAEVKDLATLDQLPENVKEKVGDNPGLYAKVQFFNKKAARAVLNNPGLGVSGRVRENFVNTRTGKIVKRALVHVLGTIDPRVTGMAPWQPVDLSAYESGDVVDLSRSEYEGAVMPKNKHKADTDLSTVVLEDLDALTPEQIAAMSDEEIDAILAAHGTLTDTDPESDDDEDDEDLDDEDDTDDGVEDESTDLDDGVGDTNLTASAQRQIDLANAQAREATARANEALRRAADADWQRERAALIAAGVAPVDVDLAAPILNRPDEFIVDLSNEAGTSGEVNVAEIVRGLLDSLRGTIDLSNESGHGGMGNGEGDPDAEILDIWESHSPTRAGRK